MPVTKQAIKKVRQDKRKTLYNARKKRVYKNAVKKYLKNPTDDGLNSVYVAVDRAAKTNIIHKNKASRLKSRLSKKIVSKSKNTTVKVAKSKKS